MSIKKLKKTQKNYIKTKQNSEIYQQYENKIQKENWEKYLEIQSNQKVENSQAVWKLIIYPENNKAENKSEWKRILSVMCVYISNS